MAKKKAEDPRLREVAEGLIDTLESLRLRGRDAYPTTLRALAEAASLGDAPDAEIVLTVASKKPFTERAAVSKVNRKVVWDSPVYFKGDKAAEKAAKSLGLRSYAQRFALVLESQRRLGGDAYPTTVGRLAELSELKPEDKRLKDILKQEAFTDRAQVVMARQPPSDSLALLREDSNFSSPEVTATLIGTALADATDEETEVISASKLASKLEKSLIEGFHEAVRRNIETSVIPPGIGWLRAGKVKNKGQEYLLFSLGDIQSVGSADTAPIADGRHRTPEPAPPPPSPTPTERIPAPGDGFAAAFREAFRRLDRENRSTNLVRLFDLRRALPGYDRGQFDAGLRQLRVDDEFTLNSHDGRHEPISDEVRQAGINESGTWLVYASRKD